jgi:hypothetical protein
MSILSQSTMGQCFCFLPSQRRTRGSASHVSSSTATVWDGPLHIHEGIFYLADFFFAGFGAASGFSAAWGLS